MKLTLTLIDEIVIVYILSLFIIKFFTVMMVASEIEAAATIFAVTTSGVCMGILSSNIKELMLALSSSFCVGASFIVKNNGLKKVG